MEKFVGCGRLRRLLLGDVRDRQRDNSHRSVIGDRPVCAIVKFNLGYHGIFLGVIPSHR